MAVLVDLSWKPPSDEFLIHMWQGTSEGAGCRYTARVPERSTPFGGHSRTAVSTLPAAIDGYHSLPRAGAIKKPKHLEKTQRSSLLGRSAPGVDNVAALGLVPPS